MSKILPNDIWVASGADKSQVVYHIHRLFKNIPNKRDFNPTYPYHADMVQYSVRNTAGKIRKLSYPVYMFLNNTVGPNGTKRRLAIRPLNVR